MSSFYVNFQDDKKFYQMELVNRETNFNKVFSAAPNVGVMNPLNAKVRPRMLVNTAVCIELFLTK